MKRRDEHPEPHGREGQDPFQERKRDPDRSYQKSIQQGALFVWLALGLLLVFYYLGADDQQNTTQLQYSEFLQAVDSGQVAEVTLRGQDIEGRFTEAGVQARGDNVTPSFTTLRPDVEDARLLERLEQQDVTIVAQPTEPAWWLQILVRALPWILILGLLFWLWNRMAQRAMSGQGGLFNFGRYKARKVRKEDSDVRLDQVAGADSAKQEITEVIEFLKDPEHFQRLGADIPRGMLLMGPPGTGKTLMARAVAGEANVPFYSISGSEFIEMFVGVGASRVRDMFKEARENAPAVIFIDELDAIGRTRGAGMGGGHDEREQTLNQILSQMDGFDSQEPVVVLAATNRPDVLDPALLRPGRFDRKITMDRPDRKAREAILGVHTKKIPLADDVELHHLAEITTGFSGADLANLVNEAALMAGRNNQDRVDWSCFTQARDRLMLGQARDTVLSDRERHIVSYHESGHALLAYLLPNADPVEKVTVIPRTHTLGVTAQVPREDRYNFGEAYLRDRIAVMFGGRLAESIEFGEVSTGAENDLKQATDLARRMVARWGMSERIGPAAFAESEDHVFLGKEMAKGREHSEATATLIDQEIETLLKDIEAEARDLLKRNEHKLKALAEALEKQETLEASDVERILEQAA
ncbi:ATP-dependent zinc metalloprotease FtsH [Saccharospirillum salsuginis]|uniref:ATP-dependent zinc metalloprotease FtsH n=1 Tax=Saccharospirillum salsuginis TaxID=418750 RepID=A0A918KJS3_9GAMM|nr:ATP-dependent zinc metalloprotease FtsH [Saccharospirillum salsuginis]GGX65856.1 ATP-dependent zinc metalloprotease FtsH [Saccharospirillum salsuginis]